jgi:hypothetical protein
VVRVFVVSPYPLVLHLSPGAEPQRAW